MNALYHYSAAQTADLLKTNQVTCAELIDTYLQRIDQVNPQVNALTRVFHEDARQQAEKLDQLPEGLRGPLHGLPFTVKESIDCKGTPTTYGVPSLANAMARQDAPCVSRLKDAGAILIGRSNLSEFGIRICTDNPLHGATENPWNSFLTPAGSSGGEAVALASGFSCLGLANDSGGSLRSPAYCCGVAGLKPTQGRVPHASAHEPMDMGFVGQQFLSNGPMARTVRDLALSLPIISGRHPRDPRSLTVDLSQALPKPEKPIAIVKSHLGQPFPQAIQQSLTLAEIILRDEGFTVEAIEIPDLEETNDLWAKFFVADYQQLMRQIQPALSQKTFHYLLDLCRLYDGEDLNPYDLHRDRSKLQRFWQHLFNSHAAIICPTWTQPPWPVDADLDPQTGLNIVSETTQYLLAANVLGLPAVSMPVGIEDGLPGGIQIYSEWWREDLCLGVGQIIEQHLEPITPIDPRF